MRLEIACDWRGRTLPSAQHAFIEFVRSGDQLRVSFDAPYFADPAPSGPPGPTPRLWEHEVIELFIADGAEHYLELEFGPHGHHLALELAGVRRVLRDRMPLDYDVRIDGGRYRGAAVVPVSYLPRSPARVNAYLIHGSASARCYHAHAPTLGPQPDFHQLEKFVPLSW